MCCISTIFCNRFIITALLTVLLKYCQTGSLIGITTLTTSSGFSIGFAIPVNYAMSIAQQIIDTGEAHHAYLGVSMASLDSSLASQVGVVMTDAGSTWPTGVDPLDSEIRIAPTLPPIEELDVALDVFCCCVKLAYIARLLAV